MEGAGPRTTLVTCLYDVRTAEGSASRRSIGSYLQSGEFLLGLDEDVVFFVEPSLAGEVEARRAARGLAKRTVVVPLPFDSLPCAPLLEEVRAAREVNPPRWQNLAKDTPRYVVLGWSKPGLVKEAARRDPFRSERFGWIDFGIAHVATTVAEGGEAVFHPVDPRVGLLQIERLPLDAASLRETCMTQTRHFVAGGFFIGDRAGMERFAELFDTEARAALGAGFAPLEQNLFALVLAKEPSLFRTRRGEYNSILDAADGASSASSGSSVRLCLNMIVRNEAAIIDRCLAAAAPWIDCWAICDTGSSDGTGERIRRFFEEAGIPGELHDAPFVDFASARNAALEAARASREPFDYILFADADMELVVEDPGFRERLGGEVYLVTQRAGISYRNVRLLRRDAAARYVGATHEYLETAARPEPLDGLWFRDHADGSNRAEKLERDLRLLGAGLEREPENARYMFYLAQTLRDAGRPAEALEWYRRRVAAGGSAEEAWYAAYAASLCLRDSGDAAGFVRQAWEAYEARPWRAEPLYHLAVRYRETGRNESCVAACEVGERIPYPAGDALFVEDQVYASGFRAEIAIAGFYCADAARRRRARAECLSLSTDPSVPPWAREGARANSAHYARRADEEFGGCDVRPLEIPLEAPWFPLNPSIWIEGERRLAIVRSVNYAVDDFRYTVLDGTGLFRTRNWLATLDAEFRVTSAREIRDLARGPARHPSHWDGFEDCRLFSLGGRLHASATVLDRSPDPRAEIALLELDDAGDVTSVEVQRSVRPDVHQKNWVPLVRGGELLFVYKTDPTVLLGYDPESRQARVRQVGRPPLRLEALRGGSQAIRVPGGWLYVAHEVVFGEPPRRKYLHRFVLLDEGLRVAAVTDPFTFLGRDIELCAGLARDGESGRLVASFGVDDARACVALLDEKAVLARLGPRADAQ